MEKHRFIPATTCRLTAQTEYLVELLRASLLIVSVLSCIIGYSYLVGRPNSDQPPGIGGLLPPADAIGFSMSIKFGTYGFPVSTPNIIISLFAMSIGCYDRLSVLKVTFSNTGFLPYSTKT